MRLQHTISWRDQSSKKKKNLSPVLNEIIAKCQNYAHKCTLYYMCWCETTEKQKCGKGETNKEHRQPLLPREMLLGLKYLYNYGVRMISGFNLLFTSLKPRLSVPDFVYKAARQIRNGKPGFEASFLHGKSAFVTLIITVENTHTSIWVSSYVHHPLVCY